MTYGAQNQPTSKVKRYKSGGTHGIPPKDGFESNSEAAPNVPTRPDVFEAPHSPTVQPGIEKTKWVVPIRNTVVIKQRDHARRRLDIDGQLTAWDGKTQSGRSQECGTTHPNRATRAASVTNSAVEVEYAVFRLCGDIRETTSFRAAKSAKSEKVRKRKRAHLYKPLNLGSTCAKNAGITLPWYFGRSK